ncbi:amino acid transporter [Pandoraea capi]|uniref:Amino acid transporter n=1 Tax=Pandoraea capi TaxID=2508286 RepID=A0ABY6W371_9BURK|nr:LysE family translocator [Pandoraea capi]VVE20893.1 amino acid transporter [Pandoraea capi]
MVDWSAVVTVFSVYMASAVIPGPNFVAITHKAVAGKRSDTFALVAGIVMVNLFWATCAMLGIGAVFAIFPWLAVGVRIAGAAYLIWFGLRLVMSARATPSEAGRPPKAPRFRAAFLQGIATNIEQPLRQFDWRPRIPCFLIRNICLSVHRIERPRVLESAGFSHKTIVPLGRAAALRRNQAAIFRYCPLKYSNGCVNAAS